MEKKYHKNILEDFKEFSGINVSDWNKANIDSAQEWNERMPNSKETFEKYYHESLHYTEAMVTYNHTGKKLRLIEKICKIIKTLDVKTIVDFGCGVGSDSMHLSNLGYSVTAMDLAGQGFNFTKFRLAKHKFTSLNIVEIVENTKIPHCDMILSLDTLEHVFDPYETLKTFFKADSKYILLTTAFGVHKTAEHEIPQHTDYKVKDIEKFLEANGYLKIKLDIPFPPRLFIKK